MNYRPFGKTGLEVSPLVFGGGAVGGLLINADDDTRRRAIRMALDAGINWFDTAASYGDGRSETALGWLLGELGAHVHVSTKVGLDAQSNVDVGTQIETSLRASLDRLQRDSVTLVQLHNPIGAETRGRQIAARAVLGPIQDGFERVRELGLAHHIGFTALGESPALNQVIEDGRFESAQVYYNLLNPSAARPLPRSWPVYDFDGILAACAGQGMATMGIRVLSAGVIATDQRTGREQPLTPGDTVDSETDKAARLFATVGNRFGSRAQTAIRFALAAPGLSCAVVGLAEIAHLEEALAAETMGPLDQAALNVIESVYLA